MKRFVVLVAFLPFCGMTSAAEIDFDTEIVPLLSKAGCNAASCHGGAAGQAGFRLSLFGGDPEFDYRTIVRELSGRRINHLNPTESLLLAKPTGQLDHGGGEVLDAEGNAARTIAQWIAAGTPRLQLRQLTRLEITPDDFVADSVPATFQLHVMAIFDDGGQRDVTGDAVYVSQNESNLQVDTHGNATVSGPGRHTAVIRFGNQVTTVSVMTPIGSAPIVWSPTSAVNWIDKEINATLALLRLPAAPPTRDAAFVRRLSLDLTGRLPTRSQVDSFIGDTNDTKRAELIDQLLESNEFTNYWTHRLSTQLRLRKPGVDAIAANTFYEWLKQQIANDIGWNDVATSLIMSEGDSHQHGAATVHRFFATGRDEAEYMSEVLMGVRLRCANCHNHPLDQWTQDDYHGLAAIFAGFERAQHVRFTGRGSVIHPRTGATAIARIPGEHFLAQDTDKRRAFVDWLTSSDNPYFAQAMVGRVWEALMGRGLVNPVDDLRATNPASHPQLLKRLAGFFADHEFRIRPLIREICNSAAYQRSSLPLPDSPNDDRYYSYAIKKPLSAEVLADAISDVTDVPGNYGGVARAVDVVDRTSSAGALQFLGQCLPELGCSASSGSGRGIASKLHLMNGELLNEKIIDQRGRLQRILAGDAAAVEVVHEFYMRALCRPPSEREQADWIQRIESAVDAKDRAERCEDFLWALLNCQEFTTNN